MHPCEADAQPRAAATVAEAMLTIPRTFTPHVTVAEVRAFFADDHVHAALVVAGGILLAVVERDDLRAAAGPQLAVGHGRLTGRTVARELPLDEARRRLDATGGRRLAVVDADGRLLGLLCLKRSRQGFCSDADVRGRAAGRAQARSGACADAPAADPTYSACLPHPS